ncbi:casein kinase I isoform delta [Metarhizium album ARSEF 1941]|uniref:non-specific serine/threonine protein kinase n=1 Tax=Metarhizium album (strain ARSEF 1941) TaxID=1081103 RepID=A0A0B2X5E5_METAS|nr:casein kinase I isoform delta [Metarhizium album ARSEF 1941]KHO00983.1 casein kinase I isoform delta [Metarhizium album ARSEF 1941]
MVPSFSYNVDACIHAISLVAKSPSTPPLLSYTMKDILIDGKYRVDRKIGQGGFGLVYLGTDIRSNEEVALKLMHIRDESDALQTEAEAYKALSGGVGMPKFLWFGQECDYFVLVHELLGPSLEDLLNYCDRRFSLKTVLLIADQAITRLEYIHSKGLLHRDVKPDNFLLGVGKRGNILYTIDFGLAKEHCDIPKWHEKFDGNRPLCGTSRYASINNHEGREQSWRDDLESLGYTLIYFAHGSLPWQGMKAATSKDKVELVREKKKSTPVETLCSELPEEFATYINYTRSLGFEDKPNYAYLRRLFRRLFISKGFKYDNVFDWTEKRFYELCETAGELEMEQESDSKDM